MTDPIEAVIFDLDGTLIDSAPHISHIINDMLAERGAERTIDVSEARAFLTQGGHELVAALLANDIVDAEQDVVDFRQRYAARRTPDDCLFDGVRDGTLELQSRGFRLAVCSNKPQALCDKIVADLGLDSVFDAVVGSEPPLPLKPAPDLALRALSRLGVELSACAYVGDSEVDRLTAAATGLPYLFVTYGYAEPGVSIDAAEQFDRFGDVVAFIADRGARR